MTFSQSVLLILVALGLSGCPPLMPILMAPTQYLGMVVRDQCYAKLDPVLQDKVFSYRGDAADITSWHKAVARCEAIQDCLEAELLATKDYDHDDWPVINKFYHVGYAAVNTPEMMRLRITPEDTIALERFRVFSKTASICRKV